MRKGPQKAYLVLTTSSAIYAQDVSFLADAARFSAKTPYSVAALSAERYCVAAFSADAAKLHKVELYPEVTEKVFL